MTPTTDIAARDVLINRRRQLEHADRIHAQPDIRALLADVDAALDRLDRGTYGVCDVCHEHIGTELGIDPLALSCREHPSPRERARLERDLTMARRVQRGLLPDPAGALPGWTYQYLYTPAGDVGGDFVDVLPNRETGEALVLVGDVSGKGVAASMLMSSLLATVRSLSSVGLPPAELLSRVNALFHDSTAPSAYATMAAALLRPNGETDLYSAGHWPPIFRRARTLEPLAVDAGLPIGLFPDARYEPTRVRLAPDDTLLFYTDGAIDEDDGTGEAASRVRLGDVLTRANGDPLGVVLAACLADVTRSRDGRPASDDLLLFAVRKADSSSYLAQASASLFE
jgi:sigma-B regulation protein RsbU (phosphoserine phosphatase)